eukprot:403346992
MSESVHSLKSDKQERNSSEGSNKKEKVNKIMNEIEISDFKKRCQDRNEILEELGKSYSENDIGQFHLDSLPAVLSEFLQLIEIVIQKRDIQELSDDQDLEILDTIVEYIATTFKKSQFINDETIMFQIDDVVALVDRYLKDFQDKYKLIEVIDQNPKKQSKEEKDLIRQQTTQKYVTMRKQDTIQKSEKLEENEEFDGSYHQSESEEGSPRHQISPPVIKMTLQLDKIKAVYEQVKTDHDYKEMNLSWLGIMHNAQYQQIVQSVYDEIEEQVNIEDDEQQEEEKLDQKMEDQKSEKVMSRSHSISSNESNDGIELDAPEKIIENQQARDEIHFHLPSPRFADIQYIKELSEEQDHVITLDEGLLNVNLDDDKIEAIPQVEVQDKFSLREAILKTIAEYQSILDNKRYKDDDDRDQIEKIIEKLRRQLDGEQDNIEGFQQYNINEIGAMELKSDQDDSRIVDNRELMLIRDENRASQDQLINEKDLLIDSKKLSNLSPEEQKLQNLQEIFLIYCRQHVMTGKNPTFDDIKKEVRNLNLGEFIKFSKDFDFKLGKDVVMKVYKKLALYSREMYFTQFKQALIQLVKEQNLLKIHKIKHEQKEVREALKKHIANLKSEEPQIQKPINEESQEVQQEDIEVKQSLQENNVQEKPIENSEIVLMKKRLQKLLLEEQKLKLENEDNEKLYQQVTEDILEVEDPAKYRKKIKGFTAAFGVSDKQERLQDLINPDPSHQEKGKVQSDKQEYSFKPFLYKDQYKKKVGSVIREKINQRQQSNRSQLPEIKKNQSTDLVLSNLNESSYREHSPPQYSRDYVQTSQSKLSNILLQRLQQREQNSRITINKTSRTGDIPRHRSKIPIKPLQLNKLEFRQNHNHSNLEQPSSSSILEIQTTPQRAQQKRIDFFKGKLESQKYQIKGGSIEVQSLEKNFAPNHPSNVNNETMRTLQNQSQKPNQEVNLYDSTNIYENYYQKRNQNNFSKMTTVKITDTVSSSAQQTTNRFYRNNISKNH